jgi:hypothetical protein
MVLMTPTFSMPKLIFLLFLAVSTTVEAQQQKYILGKLLDSQTQQGIELATVVNQRTKQTTRSNKKGAFFLYANPGDSIIATNLNGRVGIKWDGQTEDPVLFMKQVGRALPEVIVTTKREETLRRELEQVLREPEATKNLSVDQVLNLAQSPVTLLYEMFSRRARSDRQVLVLMQQARKRKLANYRLELIAAQATRLRGEELERFLRFCNFEEEFLLAATEYDLTYETLQAYQAFKRRR